MKKLFTLTLTVMLVAGLAGSAAASSIAGKIWYAGIDVDEVDPALMYGATASLDLGENLWISGMYLMGTYEDVYGPGLDFDTSDAEVVFGFTLNILDIGIGARYSEWAMSAENDELGDMAIYGPMAYIGLGNLIGELPIGWYVGGSYMFLDLGDASDIDGAETFEHYNVEGGLFLAMEPLSATLGYRIKDYVNFDDSMFSGVAASLGFGF